MGCFWELATEAHTTIRYVMRIFFGKSEIQYAFCCFQNIVFMVLNIYLKSINSIDKVKFNIIISKIYYIFF
jgi:hypothetical protein